VKALITPRIWCKRAPARVLLAGTGRSNPSWRARIANKLIPRDLRPGGILDIGCGTYPYFLAHTEFQKKFAIDQLPIPSYVATSLQIESYSLNLNQKPFIPFEDSFFNIVTLLAVVEHLNPESMAQLLSEIYRVLRPGGRVILTTPAAWSNGLLHMMARVGLVSAEEINEHAYAYTLPIIGWYFGRAGFALEKSLAELNITIDPASCAPLKVNTGDRLKTCRITRYR
jgi:SAM-dependent methyltransferase